MFFSSGECLSVTNTHYGNFFLRIGTIGTTLWQEMLIYVWWFYILVFGIGSLVYTSIEIGGFFDVDTWNDNFLELVRPSLQILFIFCQMYFVFQNHKVTHSSPIVSLPIFSRWESTRESLWPGWAWCTWLPQTSVFGSRSGLCLIFLLTEYKSITGETLSGDHYGDSAWHP